MIRCSLPITGRQATFFMLAAMALANGGCLAVAAGAAAGGAGAAGYAYMKGKVSYTFDSSLDDTWAAARKSLAEMKMPILAEERQTNHSGYFRSETSDGTPVRVYLEAVENDGPPPTRGTEVSVRVGTWGDYTASDQVLRQLSAHLVPIAPPPNGGAGATAGSSWSAVNPGPEQRIQPQPIPPIRIEPPLPPDGAQPATRTTPTAAPPIHVPPPPPPGGTEPPPLLPPQPVRP